MEFVRDGSEGAGRPSHGLEYFKQLEGMQDERRSQLEARGILPGRPDPMIARNSLVQHAARHIRARIAQLSPKVQSIIQTSRPYFETSVKVLHHLALLGLVAMLFLLLSIEKLIISIIPAIKRQWIAFYTASPYDRTLGGWYHRQYLRFWYNERWDRIRLQQQRIGNFTEKYFWALAWLCLALILFGSKLVEVCNPTGPRFVSMREAYLLGFDVPMWVQYAAEGHRSFEPETTCGRGGVPVGPVSEETRAVDNIGWPSGESSEMSTAPVTIEEMFSTTALPNEIMTGHPSPLTPVTRSDDLSTVSPGAKLRKHQMRPDGTSMVWCKYCSQRHS